MKRKKRTARELEVDPADFGVIPAYRENEEYKEESALAPFHGQTTNIAGY